MQVRNWDPPVAPSPKQPERRTVQLEDRWRCGAHLLFDEVASVGRDGAHLPVTNLAEHDVPPRLLARNAVQIAKLLARDAVQIIVPAVRHL